MRHLKEKWGEIPDHLKPVELLEENRRTIEIYNLVGDQVRVSWGKAYALDLSAVVQVLSALEIYDIESELRKLKLCFEEEYLRND